MDDVFLFQSAPYTVAHAIVQSMLLPKKSKSMLRRWLKTSAIIYVLGRIKWVIGPHSTAGDGFDSPWLKFSLDVEQARTFCAIEQLDCTVWTNAAVY